MLCGSCHRVPPPDVLPKALWLDNVTRMFSMSTNRQMPPPGSAVGTIELPDAWLAVGRRYEARAPERLPPPDAWPLPDEALRFSRHTLPAPGNASSIPAIANVRLVDLTGDGKLEIIASDMRRGAIVAGRASDFSSPLSVVAQLTNPAHIEPADFDKDGVLDLLVADLGTFLPSDRENGAVVWLRGLRGGRYQAMVLDGWPRVADLRPGDFDADGRLDLAVAAFGWRQVGRLSILRNTTVDRSEPSFTPLEIDRRTGAVHAHPVDLDLDGRLDLVTLFAQEHETVVAFMNKGDMQFEPRTIYEAPHPHWGSSGIHVVDLDTDGDLDIVLTNGDMLDDALVKPYHGVTWLENRGTFPFEARPLAQMPGAYRAQTADLDSDGDLDIVACALVPLEGAITRDLPALVWLEQTSRGVFSRHTLKRGLPRHATLDVGDIDNDGAVDIALGYMPGADEEPVWVEIWRNLGAGPRRTDSAGRPEDSP